MANTSTSLTIKNNYVQPMDNNHHDKLSKKNDPKMAPTCYLPAVRDLSRD